MTGSRFSRQKLIEWQAKLDPHFVPGGRVYLELIQEKINKQTTLLDLGCGDRGYIEAFKDDVQEIIGLDQDPKLLARNTIVDSKLSGDGEHIPLPDTSLDMVVSEFVLEHLEHPKTVFQEIHRVLKPGGYVVIITPNLLHPVFLLSLITPHGFHIWYRQTFFDKHEHDTHKTYYRANTRRTLQKLVSASGLQIESMQSVSNPEYYIIHQALTPIAIIVDRFLRTIGLPMYWIVRYTKN
jgi:ubiquinone/menaquinone biosynthesis C-methylase UbiE